MRLGEAAFECVDALGAFLGIGIAEKLEDGGDVFAIGGLERKRFDPAIYVVAVVRHAETRL